MELDAVADELYGLSLDDFILTRNVLEKQAKGANDKVLAAEIHRLPKPNAIAWLINQLVRQHNDEIQTLLALGSSMREATATFSGDRLRELSRQQHAVIRGLVQQAEELAHASGREISAATARSLEETFYAALADSGSADAVAAGRLTTGLQSTGFSTFQTTSQQGTQSTTKPPSKTKGRGQGGSGSRAEWACWDKDCKGEGGPGSGHSSTRGSPHNTAARRTGSCRCQQSGGAASQTTEPGPGSAVGGATGSSTSQSSIRARRSPSTGCPPAID